MHHGAWMDRWAIFKAAKNPEGSWEFLKFIASPEGQTITDVKRGSPSSRKSLGHAPLVWQSLKVTLFYVAGPAARQQDLPAESPDHDRDRRRRSRGVRHPRGRSRLVLAGCLRVRPAARARPALRHPAEPADASR